MKAAYRRALGALLLLLALLLILALAVHPEGLNLHPSDVVLVLLHKTPVLSAIPHRAPEQTTIDILWELRLPRALAAMLIGALLACAGIALQGLLMNPLADPYTVGVSAGAAVGAAAAETAGFAGAALGFAGVACAFGAGVAAVLLVYLIASSQGRITATGFLLAGVVVGAMLWSLIPVFLMLAGRSDDAGRILFFLLGSVKDVDWPRTWVLLPTLIFCWTALRIRARDLNLLAMGEESAAHLGLNIEAARRHVLAIGALATAAAVSIGGIIAFVGLVVPHLARKIAGPDHRQALPLAAVLGACLLLAADILVRVWLDEMPLGVVTSLIGAPVFCWLLRKHRSA